MYKEEFSPCKVNLSLRITSIRDDGFHDLVSLFYKIRKVERLTISEITSNNVKDDIICHNFNIPQQNIIEKVLSILRGEGWNIPPLEIEILKELPPGTGLGGGSGNASALLNWLGKRYSIHIPPERSRTIGADVAFLNSRYSCALVSGIGDQFVPRSIIPGLVFVIFIPQWTSGTVESYRNVDMWYKTQGFPLRKPAAEAEADAIVARLNKRLRWGCLPNDFLPVLIHEWPEYLHLFDSLDKTDALAWGITGSGSASFAIFQNDREKIERCLNAFNSFTWLNRIFIWSDDR